MDTDYHLRISPDADALSEAAAGMIIDIAEKSVSERDRFIWSLSGGSTPEKLFTLLATDRFRNRIPWEKTYILWGDERCVPANDPRSNAHMAKNLLLDKTIIPATNIFAVQVELSPIEAALAYEKSILDLFKTGRPVFDCMLLGLGGDAHTASLFPGTPVLHEKLFLVKEVYAEEQEMFRVTMTAPLINQSRFILFLVTGHQKASAVQKVLNEPFDPEIYPAQLIKPENGELYWLLDKAAASKL